jgi:iron complex transport system substrate-binding protein
VDRTPGTLRDLYAVLPGSFLAEVIGIAGGRVVGGTAASGYGRISKETILAVDPDVILDVMAAMTATGGTPEAAWHELPELKAVKRGNIHAILDEFATHDSQMIGHTAALIAHLLHPEVPRQDWESR